MSRERPLKAAISLGWRALDIARRPPPRLTILYYHGVAPEEAASFDAQMAYLAANANIVHADHAGPLAADRPNVAVTFDDAFRSVAENALAALVRHGAPATIYAPSAWLGRTAGWAMEGSVQPEVVMGPDELRALPAELIRIASHSATHARLGEASEAQVRSELADSRARLEDVMGYAVDTLAYPYGSRSDRSDALAAEAGYRHVYGVVPEAIAAGATATLRGRTPAYPSDPDWIFRLKAQGAFDWVRTASALKRRLTRRR